MRPFETLLVNNWSAKYFFKIVLYCVFLLWLAFLPVCSGTYDIVTTFAVVQISKEPSAFHILIAKSYQCS